VRGRLGEKLAQAIVYVSDEPRSAGERVAVADAIVEFPWPGSVVFVDLEPGVNWGHACSYLAVRSDADDVIAVAAHMPPFLKAGGARFRCIWRGPQAPEWAVVE
jgi:hypothetical protein